MASSQRTFVPGTFDPMSQSNVERSLPNTH